MTSPRWKRFLGLSLWLAGLAGGSASGEYFAVCDAGSTGTRLYVFLLDAEGGKAKSVFVKKRKPGLSSYRANPDDAVPPLLELLKEGAATIPEERRAKVPLLIYGTAGMRLLPAGEQSLIWSTLHAQLAGAKDFPFDQGAFQARTVSGDEEGLWAVLATNFLTGRMGHDLLSHGQGKPLGLMDLGGSSTQIGIPSPVAAEKGINFSSGVLVKSYLGFGMTHIQHKVRSKFGSDLSCYMPGSQTKEEGPLQGDRFGDAPNCRKLIADLLQQESTSCLAESQSACLGDLKGNQESSRAIEGDVDFYGVSGLTYVMDFVRWWLQNSEQKHPFLDTYPKPTLNELQSAVDLMCSGQYQRIKDWTDQKSMRHQFTDYDNLPFRCFQANYILVLLGEVYGFAKDSRKVTFALEVDGEDLEWPLGALLHGRSQPGQAEATGEL
mmetsp:Transcript_46674/g.109017  ORF Transcript_46674/g.109017 Transcript_46674/m.109017 type:complete len:436 (+) Transcript_46674:69-1376(+)